MTAASHTSETRRIRIGQVPIDAVTFDGALAKIAELVAAKKGGSVFTPNIDHIVLAEKDARLRAAYAKVSLSLVDGTLLLWASRVLEGGLPEKVSGSDLVVPLMKMAAEKGFRVYFLGGADGVGAKAAAVLRTSFPKLQIVGWSSPRIALGADAATYAPIVDAIKATNPDLLLIALGCPKQELFVDAASELLGPIVCVGVGASLDFVAGVVKRAPTWMSRAGLEWAFRLGQEPKRLWHRYLVQDPQFLAILARDLKSQRASRPRQ